MKKILVAVIFPLFLVFAQNASLRPDKAAIERAALDYAEGFYSGDAGRMEKAIHPDLNKSFPRFIARTGRDAQSYTTYSQLIELTSAKAGLLADSARHLEVNVLSIDGDAANAKVTSANFNDYLQLVRIGDQWKIVNVLWNGGPAAAARWKGVKAEEERGAIEETGLAYLDGLFSADAKKLEGVLDQDFNKVTLTKILQTGKPALQRQRYESIVENALARIGKQDESARSYDVKLLDVMDGLAVVKAEVMSTTEYLQLYKSGKQWRIVNSIVVPKANQPLTAYLPAIAGEPMIDFTLPVYSGGDFKLSDHRGKNILLVFPRGWVGRVWCPYCVYQYLELAQLEKSKSIRKKNDLEIVFVMPYTKEKIADWFDKIPDALQTLERTKTPPDPADGNMVQVEYAQWAAKHFPQKFDVKKGEAPTPFPVLVDGDRTLSKQLKLFVNFWDGVTSEQNMASAFIIDKKGILRFKYIGQMTEDRPSVEYLIECVGKL